MSSPFLPPLSFLSGAIRATVRLTMMTDCTACLLISGKVSGYMGERQKLWLEAMQTRITTTVAAINSIKGIKATGATNILQSVITQLRRYEIKSSIKFREVLVMLVTLCRC